ncbi:MAG: aldehyde ferredoxin oxidoreductase N-terminal domain-containing protein [Promethearchaeota archaeon]|jgi:aldehyde:ferredoxin oxidoreductase
MKDWYGYTGKILKVDLTNDKIKVKNERKEDLRLFIGGMGMNCKLGAEILKPNLDPFSEENVIILGAGPLVGTITPGSSRTVGLSKFPATGAIANSCGSMSFGFNLKHAGFDHIIISGKSEKKVYLAIMDDHVELIDAAELWGKDIIETTNFLWKKAPSRGVIAIGQAGENLVHGSLALIDKTSTFGRGGLGAIMGSKNLKAIIVKGTKGLPIAYPKEFFKLYEKQNERIRNYIHRDSWIELGMLRSLPVNGTLYAKGEKEKAEQASEKFYIHNLKKKRIACPSCPMADKDILEIKEGEFKGLMNYTTSVINPLMMLPLDSLDSSHQAVKVFDIINRYGLDSLTITSLVDFLSRMYKEGIIDQLDLGFEWKNDFNSLIKLIDVIVHRKGFGNILADGWKKLAESNENLADEILAVKGLDIVFEPRLMRLGTMEFEQVVNPKGAHVASGGSPTYVGAGGSPERFKNHFKRMGIPDSAINRIFTPPLEEMGINVGRLTRYSEDWYTVLTSLGLCARAQMNRFWSLDLVTGFYNAVTGIELKPEDLRIAAERTWNLLKIMNKKEGFTRKDDNFPKEWFKPLSFGNNQLEFKGFLGEVIITNDIANQLLDDYYDERGWDIINGIPTDTKIKELNLKKFDGG